MLKGKTFDYQGMSRPCIEWLCRKKRLAHFSFVRDVYGLSEAYSYGRYIRKYAGFPRLLPLYTTCSHGILSILEKDTLPYPLELDSGAFCQFYHVPEFAALFHKYSARPVYLIPAPFLICRRMNRFERSQDARGTLAFFSHTSRELNMEVDISDYIARLKSLPENYQPVSVCLFFLDVQNGCHKPFFDAGIPVYSAGNSGDPKFAERFYEILRHFRYSTSSTIGSYTYYAVEMGIPFFLLGDSPRFTQRSNHSPWDDGYDKEEYRKTASLFEGLHDTISPAQKAFAEYGLGIGQKTLSPDELRKILWKAYFAKVDLLRDILWFITVPGRFLVCVFLDWRKRRKERGK